MISATLVINHKNPIKEFFPNWIINTFLHDEELEILSINSPTFKIRRTARSLLSKYAATAPFLLLSKEGVFVSALYNEEVTEEAQMLNLFNKKLEEAEHASVNNEIDDGSYFNY